MRYILLCFLNQGFSALPELPNLILNLHEKYIGYLLVQEQNNEQNITAI